MSRGRGSGRPGGRAALGAEGAGDGAQELVVVNGFLEEGDCADLFGLLPVPVRVVCRDDDDRFVPVLVQAFQPLNEAETAPLGPRLRGGWQMNVHDEQVGIFGSDDSQGGFGVRGAEGLIAGGLEFDAQGLHHDGVIVQDQDLFGAHGLCDCRPSAHPSYKPAVGGWQRTIGPGPAGAAFGTGGARLWRRSAWDR